MKLTQRLKEPSTWAGLSILGMILGLHPDKLTAIAQVAQVVAPFLPADGGVLAQTVIGLAGLGASAAVVLAEKPAKQGNDA
jgi:hypothetical protein